MTYALTKLDILALQQADYLTVLLTDGVGRVMLSKQTKKSQKNPFEQTGAHTLDAPIYVTNAGSQQGRFYSSLNFDRAFYNTHIAAVAAQLRAGDQIHFEFYADYLTSEVMKKAGLHADVLRLHVRRGRRLFVFEIDHVTAPDGAARMVQATRKDYSLT